MIVQKDLKMAFSRTVIYCTANKKLSYHRQVARLYQCSSSLV